MLHSALRFTLRLPRRIFCLLSTTAVVSLLLCGAHPASAQGSAEGSGGGRLGAPPPDASAQAPDPRVGGPLRDRRAWQFGAEAAWATRPCSSLLEDCASSSGWELRATVLSRPVPWFSWGPMVLASHTQELFRYQGWATDFETRSLGAGLAGRVWFLESGTWDPYLQVATGLGQMSRRGTSTLPGRPAVAIEDERFVPVYSAAIGIEAHVNEYLRLGSAFTWTNWLYFPQERCAEAFGVCTIPSWSSFDPDRAQWSLSASISVVTGRPL